VKSIVEHDIEFYRREAGEWLQAWSKHPTTRVAMAERALSTMADNIVAALSAYNEIVQYRARIVENEETCAMERAQVAEKQANHEKAEGPTSKGLGTVPEDIKI